MAERGTPGAEQRPPGGDGWKSAGGTARLLLRLLRSPLVLRVLLPLAAGFFALKLLLSFCFTYVGPNQYGIKVVRVPLLGGERGVHKEVYDAGFHRVLRPLGLEEMYLFPRDV